MSDAKAEAPRIVIALGNTDSKVAALSYRDAASLVRLHETTGPLGVTLEAAADVFAGAAGLVGVHQIVEACRAFAQRHPAAREKHPLAKTADEFCATKRSQGRGARHLVDISTRLGPFVHEHPGSNVGDITAPAVQNWLDGLRGTGGEPLAPQIRRNFATVLSGFFEHCRKRGMILDDPMSTWRGRRSGARGTRIFTPRRKPIN